MQWTHRPSSEGAPQGPRRIEQCFGKLKHFKRVALRYEKAERSFAAIVALALSFILIKSVHTA